jgi:hypothetical protein
LPDPFGPSRRISPGDIPEEILEAKGFSVKSRFEKDQKRESMSFKPIYLFNNYYFIDDKLLRQGLDSTESN